MRRHDSRFAWLYRKLLLPLYRFAALYGESYWRPLLLYAFLAGLLFAPLYLAGGFRGAAGDVHRDVWAGIGALWDGALWGDYLQAVYLALTAGVPFRTELHVVSPWVVGPYFANALLNILLLALTVIALRRQFKR
ncbi:MAG: hypothetical protein Q8O76_11250, partial [Chloroflexota bacterium]|nr:hypothetical protein [Chloroflexota bacterium]